MANFSLYLQVFKKKFLLYLVAQEKSVLLILANRSMTGAAEMLCDTWQFPENFALDANLIKARWKNLCSNSVFGCKLKIKPATPNTSIFCFQCVLHAIMALVFLILAFVGIVRKDLLK